MKKMKTRILRMIAGALMLALIIASLCGCFGDQSATTQPAKENTGSVSPEEPVLALNGVTVDFYGGINLTGDTEASVVPQPVETDETGGTRAAYDISLEGQSEFKVPLKITLPYEGGTNACPQYFNPGTNEWETILIFERDEGAKTISFYTSHLSLYSVYEFSDLKTPQATIAHLASGALDGVEIVGVLEEMVNEGAPGTVAASNFIQGVEEFLFEGTLHKSADPHGILTEGISSALISIGGEWAISQSERLSTLNSYCGLGMAVFRMTAKGVQGDDTGAARIGYEYVFTNLGSWVGIEGYSIASLAIIPIKYALSEFEQGAYAANLAGTKKAYNAYYQNSNGNWHRSDDDWIDIFINAYMKAWQNGEPDIQYLADAIDYEINAYVDQFWNSSDFEKQLEGKLGGADTWIAPNLVSASDKAALRQSFYYDLMERLHDYAFPAFERFLQEKAREQFEKPFLDYMKIMNTTITVTLDEEIEQGSFEEPKYHGYIVRFENEDRTDPDFIRETLPDYGSAYQLPYFTLLGYCQYGLPSKIALYKTEADLRQGDAEVLLNFKLDVRDPVIPIGNGEDIEGVYSFDVVRTSDRGDEAMNYSKTVTVYFRDGSLVIKEVEGDYIMELVGSFNESTGEFVGIDPNMPEKTGTIEDLFSASDYMIAETKLTFDNKQSPVTAKGACILVITDASWDGWNGTTTHSITMTKISDLKGD